MLALAHYLLEKGCFDVYQGVHSPIIESLHRNF